MLIYLGKQSSGKEFNISCKYCRVISSSQNINELLVVTTIANFETNTLRCVYNGQPEGKHATYNLWFC